MKFGIFLFALLTLGLSSCSKTRVCECSDGYSINMTGSKNQIKQACEKYNTGEISCKVD